MPSNEAQERDKRLKQAPTTPEMYRPEQFTYDQTQSAAYQANLADINQAAQAFAYDPSGEAAINQNAAQQALQNVRGVGNAYGQYGAAQSGAAAAAAAEGAATPYYQAQLSIGEARRRAQEQQAQYRAQATSALNDQYRGIVMGQSQYEKDVASRKTTGSE